MWASQVNRCFCWCFCFYLFWFCLWRWAKTKKNDCEGRFDDFRLRWKKHGRMPRRPAAPRGADPRAAKEAANALWNLLHRRKEAAWCDLPPEPVAAALLGAMRRHPGDGGVQRWGCYALRRVCRNFPAVRGALRRDPSVLATVQKAATVAPDLEFTQELCVWLRPCLDECGTVPSNGWTGRPCLPRAKCQPKEVARFSHFFAQVTLGHISIQIFCSHTFFVHIVLFTQAILLHIFCSHTPKHVVNFFWR